MCIPCACQTVTPIHSMHMATRVQVDLYFGRASHPSHFVHFEPEPNCDLQRDREGGERVNSRSRIYIIL